MDEIEKIIAPKLSRGRAISFGKFAAKIKRISGVNEDLLGPFQPERSKREDENKYKYSGCTNCGDDFGQCDCFRSGALNTVETQ